MSDETVLFVCLHGAAKSLVAASHFRRLATEYGVEARADFAGTEPDPELTPAAVAGLLAEGIDARGRRPRRVTGDDIRRASRVVSFGCDLAALAPGVPVERWDDVPAVSENYRAARDVIVSRLPALLNAMRAPARAMTPIRWLSRRDVASLLTVEDCIPALEDAFARHAQGSDPPPALLGLHTALGGLHVKAAVLSLDRPYLVAKANANFPGNRVRSGLPTIQGIIAIVDGEDGRFLALMDSIEVTVARTAAATAIAAKHLARRDAATLTVCGCGVQGRAHVRALAHVLPLRRVRLFDADPAQAQRLAAELSRVAGLEVELATDLAAAVRASDVCVTCTPSPVPVLTRAALAPGLFVAGVGADSHDKHELAPEVLSASKVVVDHLEQCATIGDLRHALAAGAMTREAVHAELPDLVAGRRPGRETAGEITVFDSTGVATEDAAAALLVYRKALARDVGSALDLDGGPVPGADRSSDRREAFR